MRTIGIRNEPPGRRCAPLTPAAVARLVAAGHAVRILPHPDRIHPLEAYLAAGAREADTLDGCDLTVGVTPPPSPPPSPSVPQVSLASLRDGEPLPGGEAAPEREGMFRAALARLEGASLASAGLHALGKKFYWLGFDTPFDAVPPPGSHDSVAQLLARTAALGRRFHAGGLPPELPRVAVAVVEPPGASRGAGACEVLDALPSRYVEPSALPRELERVSQGMVLVARAPSLEDPALAAAMPRVSLLLCLAPHGGGESCARALEAAAPFRPLPAAIGCGPWREGCGRSPFARAGLAMHTLAPDGKTLREGFRTAGLTVTGGLALEDLFARDLTELLSERLVALLA